jgi:D-sedoheptulose 7-phosphate isomerase
LINQRLNKIEKLFLNSIQTKKLIVKDKLFNSLAVMGELATNSIINGGKIMLCGNGGSAADAQHLAAELTVRLKPMNNREGIAAISLAQDTSTITACGNDFGFDFLYERLIKSLGNDGDCLIGITTSGNSKNAIHAMKAAKKMNIKVFGFLGCDGGKALDYCDQFF